MSTNYDAPSPIRPLPNYVPVPADAFNSSENDLQQRLDLGRLVGVLLRYKMIVLGAFVSCTVLALIYAFTATPLYTASTQIKISTYQPILPATDVESMLMQKSKEADYLETQIKELKSASLADQVLSNNPNFLENLSPQKSGFWKSLFGAASKKEVPQHVDVISGYKHSPSHIKKYLSVIDLSPIRRTSLVQIDAITPDPILSAKIANAHATNYIEWGKINRIKEQSEGLKFLRSQSEELKEKVADLERERAEYAETHSIVALNKDENITVQKMAELDSLLTRSTDGRIEAEKLYEEANRALSDQSAAFDDSSTQTARTKLAELESEYSNLATKFTPTYPKMRQLAAQIKEIKSSISTQRRQIVLGLKAKALAAKEKENLLKEELEKQKSTAFELSKSQVQYNILNRELDSSRELLQNVLKQIKEMSLAVQSNSSNVSIVDAATVPESSSYPKKRLILMIGVIGGICLGLGLAFLLDYLDNSIRSPDDLLAHVNMPSLGVVPSFLLDERGNFDQFRRSSRLPSIKSSNPDTVPVLFIQNPRSVAAEAYRAIRTSVLLSRASEPPKTILVSSAQSSEGKTTTAANLAATLAGSGSRVVLIDADLRRPSLGKHFGVQSTRPGLVEVLTGQKLLAEVMMREIAPRISVITAGQIPPNPAELLGSIDMAELIDKLSTTFDYVIVDSPPVLPVTDSVILSRYVDGVVLVVKGSSTPRRIVREASARLRRVGANILGAILNDVDVKSGEYYYYHRYYRSDYKYEPDRARSNESV